MEYVNGHPDETNRERHHALPQVPNVLGGGHEGSSDVHHTEHLSPWQRLMSLAASERRDIGVVITFAIAIGVLTLATPLAVQGLVNSVAFGGLLQPVIVLAIILCTCLGFAAAMTAIQWWLVEIVQRRIFVRVVADMAYRLPRVRTEAFDRQNAQELVNRFFDVFTVQKVMASLLLDGVSLFLQAGISMLLLAFYHPFLLGFDIMLLLIMAFLIFGLGRGAVATSIAESRAKYAVAGWLEEMVRHPVAFKMSGAPEFAQARADELSIDYLVARRSHFRIMMRQICFALAAQVLASTLLLGLGGWLVISGQLTLGQLVASELMVALIVSAFTKLGKHLDSYYDLTAAVDKLGHVVDLPLELQTGESRLKSRGPATLRLCNLAFAYNDAEPIFEHVNWQIHAGERIAVCAAAGAGKSTLAELLFGLRPPTAGHIELDGVDLRDYSLHALRDYVATVKNVEMFEGTVQDNVRLGRPWVSPDSIRAALEAVGLLAVVQSLPNGLATQLCNGGGPLSSSQCVKLMIARAIVAEPRLLVLDEIIDALNQQDRSIVLPAVCRRDAPWTLIMITREDDVRAFADRTLNLDPGDGQPSPVRSTRLRLESRGNT